MAVNIFLVCNAHIDIVWLWSWEEGVAETLSTFRTAVRFCKEYEGFVFNHNEAVLYEWIEEYEPALFQEIKALVEQGRWHIMGGWYLQPDCNMPSGESFVRQILKGRCYFRDRFHADPATAINFDSFGHSRGLVQIMKKCGYDSYVVCRPGQKDFALEDNDFLWVGCDGSEIMVHRIVNGYSSGRGRIKEKADKYLEQNPGVENALLLWGIGNHGGGPSKEDLEMIRKMRQDGYLLEHTTPEDYFRAVRESGKPLKRIRKSMQHWGVGCYTSSIRVKEYHRRLESEYFSTEKMAAHAAALKILEYPRKQLNDALRDLLCLQFHDTLSGSSIKRGEDDALRLAGHGLEILSRLKLKIFLAMLQGEAQSANEDGTYRTPVYLYNPHPFEVEDIFEYELALADTIREGFGRCILENAQGPVETQTEREENNVPIQWRRRMAFQTKLKPYSMQRLDFSTVIEETAPARSKVDDMGTGIVLKNETMKVVINRQTGLLDAYQAGGKDYLREGSFLPLVFEDDHDSWGMTKNKYNILAGAFHIRRNKEGIPEVQIIEEGAVRTIVECVFEYQRSTMIIRYKVPRRGTEIEIEILLKYAEELKVVKLGIYTPYEQGKYLGDTAFGVEELDQEEQEVAAQKWVGVTDGVSMVTLINDSVYGSSYKRGSFFPTLIKSCGYAAHPMSGRKHMPEDRFIDCSDHISKTYRFYLNAQDMQSRMERIGKEALVKHERPFILNGFTNPSYPVDRPFMTLSDTRILCSAVKYAEDETGLVVRLFNTTDRQLQGVLAMELYETKLRVSLGPYEIRSFLYRFHEKEWIEVTLLEEEITRG